MRIEGKSREWSLFVRWKVVLGTAAIFCCLCCRAEDRRGAAGAAASSSQLFVSSLPVSCYSRMSLMGGGTSTKSKHRDKHTFFYREIHEGGNDSHSHSHKDGSWRNTGPIFSKKFDVAEVSSDRNKQKEKNIQSKLRLLSSASGRIATQPSARQRVLSRAKHLKLNPRKDLAIFAIYAFAIVVNTIPTICLPLMAADLAATSTSSLTAPTLTVPSSGAFSAKAAFLGTLGAALGKFLNGFVCKRYGGRRSARSYLLAASLLSMLLATTTTNHGVLIAGLEFTQSIMWTACCVLLLNLYETDPKKFAASITTLSLTSTSFVLMTKIFGMALLEFLHWRTLAKVGSFLALAGATVVHFFIQDTAFTSNHTTTINQTKPRLSIEKHTSNRNNHNNNLFSSLKSILGSKIFWFAGLSHATVYLVRGMDKILASFYQEAASMQAHIGSGMTSTVTIGFVYGLITGKQMQSFQTAKIKQNFLSLRYKKAIAATMLLVCCANKTVSSMIGKTMTSLLIAIASSVMAANVSYQFFQIPSLVAKQFGDNRAVCLSFLDAIAFLIAAPMWMLIGKVISLQSIGSHGWSLSWGLFALMLLTGGSLWSSLAPSILND